MKQVNLPYIHLFEECYLVLKRPEDEFQKMIFMAGISLGIRLGHIAAVWI